MAQIIKNLQTSLKLADDKIMELTAASRKWENLYAEANSESLKVKKLLRERDEDILVLGAKLEEAEKLNVLSGIFIMSIPSKKQLLTAPSA